METFNVVIADDHPIVVLGVRELVERDQRFRGWAKPLAPMS
jgi:two-component system capsular synthesis response regulator RcsB